MTKEVAIKVFLKQRNQLEELNITILQEGYEKKCLLCDTINLSMMFTSYRLRCVPLRWIFLKIEIFRLGIMKQIYKSNKRCLSKKSINNETYFKFLDCLLISILQKLLLTQSGIVNLTLSFAFRYFNYKYQSCCSVCS